MASTIEPYVLRRATAGDVAVIAHHRVAMFHDMGILPDPDHAPLQAASARYLDTAIPAADYRGWLIELDGRVVAGGGVVLRPLLPRPGYIDGATEAYVLNVYVEPAHRRRGLARALMEAIVAWCEARHILRISLHASDEGRPLYESLRFTASNEMQRGA